MLTVHHKGDVTKLSSDAKSKLPGKEKEVEQDTKLSAQKLGSKVDNAVWVYRNSFLSLGS